jgi:hypothetical protein
MTNNAKILILIIISAIIISCNKEKHEMWISIKNETKSTIDCRFYPTKTATDYSLTSEIDTSMKQDDIYNSGNINQKPTDLLKSAYDSIIITIPSLNKVMVFKKDLVKGYKSNPYTDLDSWGFEKLTKDFPANFSRNKTEIDNYYFSINLDNLSE